MKTVFIPVYHGMCTRNLFLTNMLHPLLNARATRLICFIPPAKKEFFAQQYGALGQNIIFEALELKKATSGLNFVFDFIAKSFLNTQAKKSLQLIEYSSDRNKIRYWLGRFLAAVFAGSRLLRNFVRWLDFSLIRDNSLKPYFKKYQPDLVFCTDVLAGPDAVFLREAKRNKIPLIGMVRSWDNLTSKGVVRVKPDKMVVHTDLMASEAKKYSDMKEKDIFISGVPVFDYYIGFQPSAKEAFYHRVNIKPDYKIILFAPFFGHYQDSVKEIIAYLDQAISAGQIAEKVKILVRLPPSYNEELGEYVDTENIIYDKPAEQFALNKFRNDWEFTEADMRHLADSLYYSCVIINFASTMTIDAAAFDKPVINIDFDGESHDPSKISIRYIYQNDHYQPVLKAGCLRLARSKSELAELINFYLSHPEAEKEGRARILKEFTWKFDGHSAERIGNYLLSYLNP